MMAGISLYSYQLDAVKRIKNGCILCGGVGSGKSRTALAYYYILNGGELNTDKYVRMDDGAIKDLYIITTARKRDTFEWEAELAPFLLSPDKDASAYSNKVVVDSWNNIKKYEACTDAFFIFDEQRVVGSGVWAKSFINIARNNQWILLSATPGDTWLDYCAVFVANGFYKNRTDFIRQHVIYKPMRNFRQVDRYVGEGRLIRLRNNILIDMDFERETVAHHEDVWCNYDISQYKEIIKTRWNPWENEPINNASDFCSCLRKIVNSSESRSIAVLDILEHTDRAIIFYNYDYELYILRRLYYGPEYEIAEWNGHKHQPIPDSKKWVYLVQYNSGAEGWNCIKTDTIIFFSQTYSYKQLAQACGRIDRLNTPYKDLYYYHLKSRAGIDIAISRAITAKKDFNFRRFYDRT